MEANVNSCMRGFHVYQDVWTPIIGEVLACRREMTNIEDRYAIAVYKMEKLLVTCLARFRFYVQRLYEEEAQFTVLLKVIGVIQRLSTRWYRDSMQANF